ncbi:site-specific integrase [Endozoicomonas euniceicola]|uniref:Tyr recombinase domain-containing protein n=1 Tax=Endozoicomonas euniceicola TaxID=1234143 RepID=A0ABY6GPV3_9GAMM|nr:hypothetical protein [Endozoicomonas euniceicola]UYM14757.1 hypothetical protein NX720_17940 [Endozoicomonas euniceicola]
MELNIFADLKTELEAARAKACSLLTATIDGCLNELPEAEESYFPLMDRQDAENAQKYADSIRKVCRLDTEINTNNTNHNTINTLPTKPEPQIPSIEALFNQYCQSRVKIGKWKPHRINWNTQQSRKALDAFIESSGITCVTEVSKGDVSTFKESILEQYSPKTAEWKFAQVASLFSWIVKNTDHLEISRFQQVGGFGSVEGNSTPPMTPDLMQQLLATSPEEHHNAYRLYYFTGIRTGELLNCAAWETKDSIKCLKITDTKTKAGDRLIPLHHSIVDLYGSSLAGCRATLNKWIRRTHEDYSVYSFRHGMANRLRAVETCTDGLLAAVLGHTQKQIAHKVYGTGFDVQRMRKVIDLIPALDERQS